MGPSARGDASEAMDGDGEKTELQYGASAKRTGPFGTAPGADVADALALQAWAQADAGVARAWRESLVLERAIEDARYGADEDEDARSPQKRLAQLRRRIETIEAVAFLLRQEIEGVARLRGLELIGDIGESLPFDPHVHNIGGLAPAEGEDVRVVAPGVFAGGRSERPLTPAEVARVSRRAAREEAAREAALAAELETPHGG